MKTGDWIAIYGALLSTLLGINELIKNFRKIRMKLRYKAIEQDVSILVLDIVNSGYRTITIMEIGLYIGRSNPFIKNSKLVSKNSEIPITLEEGQQIDFDMGLTLPLILKEDDIIKQIYCIEANGKEYKLRIPKKIREYHRKYGDEVISDEYWY